MAAESGNLTQIYFISESLEWYMSLRRNDLHINCPLIKSSFIFTLE